jgi:hypothetical protein
LQWGDLPAMRWQFGIGGETGSVWRSGVDCGSRPSRSPPASADPDGEKELRTLIMLLIGAIAGAILFHAYYLKLNSYDRCAWDHPYSAGSRTACRLGAGQVLTHASATISEGGPKARGYGKRARHELDDLIGNVSR